MRRFRALRLAAVFAGLLAAPACQAAEGDERPPETPEHHTDGGFRNPHIEPSAKNIFDYMAVKFFGETDWADHAAHADDVPRRMVSLRATPPEADEFEVTWLGHSTFLIRVGGLVLLTDPVFSDRASPVGFAGPERYVPHVMDYADLPPVDYVVISHSHYDHLDTAAIRHLADGPTYLVPLGLASWFVENGVDETRVHEFDWWDRRAFDAVSVQATPSQHWSARGLFDRNETLWASWLLDIRGARLWFAGDTGYNDVQFKQIGARAGGIDLALIPIGGYAPRWFMGPHHVDPEGAIRIHRDIEARRSIGMHWGTFPMTAEAPLDPPRELARQIERHGLTDSEFVWMTLGQTLRVAGATGSVAVRRAADVGAAE